MAGKLASIAIASVCILACAQGASGQIDARDLAELPLEDLLVLEVTSVGKKRQSAADAPAAVFVITQEDIRRAGVTRIVDALRMAPGLQIGEMDGNASVVTARGFGERTSNKLLVLIDGRQIYRSILGGVFWDQMTTPVQDIERIEVVRGPGATLWGANAVNGVINIITKHAIDTQGGRISATAGTREVADGYARYGGLFGDAGAWRVFGRAGARDRGVDVDGDRLHSDTLFGVAGFRADYEPSAQEAFTLQGEVQRGRYSSATSASGALDVFGVGGDLTGALPPFPLPPGLSGTPRLVLAPGLDPSVGFGDLNSEETYLGANLSLRWERSGTSLGDFGAQVYLDHLRRSELGVDFQSTLFGVDAQNVVRPFDRHEVVWGVNYLGSVDESQGEFLAFDPTGATLQTVAAFIQDEIELLDDELFFTIGAKLESNGFTKPQLQPSARLFWRPSPRLALWSAVSRATRTPARFEDALATTIPIGTVVLDTPGGPLPLTELNAALLGNRDLDSEELIAFEVGGRVNVSRSLSFDVATYLNVYDNLVTRPAFVEVGPTTLFGTTFANGGEAVAYGVEVSAEWRVTDNWRLFPGFSFQEIDARSKSGAAGDVAIFEDLTPRFQFSLRSQHDLSDDLELDFWLYGQDGTANGPTPEFIDLDVRLGYRLTETVELAVTGRNLLHENRLDFRQSVYPSPPTQVGRSVFATLDVRF